MEKSQRRFFLPSYETIYVAIAILMAASMTALFFGMALPVEGFYVSDTPLHISGGLILEGYGLECIYTFLIGKLFGYPMVQLIFAVIETVFVMLTWVVTQKFINEFFELDRRIVLIISTGLIFLTAIYIPYFLPDFYKEGLGTQPWHNSTYYGMRFVGVIYLMLLYRILPRYLHGISVKEWWGISLALAVATMFKPNFLLTVCFTLGSFLIVDLVRSKNTDAVKKIIVMGTTVFPALGVLFVQYVLIYITGNHDNASGVSVVLFSDLLWHGPPSYMLLKIVRSFAFCSIVIIICLRLKKRELDKGFDIRLIFSVLMFVMSLVIFSFFKETGPRAMHGNFGWGVLMAFYTMYLYIVPWFFKRFREYLALDTKDKSKFITTCFGIGLIILCLHFISGICYFCIVTSGISYYL